PLHQLGCAHEDAARQPSHGIPRTPPLRDASHRRLSWAFAGLNSSLPERQLRSLALFPQGHFLFFVDKCGALSNFAITLPCLQMELRITRTSVTTIVTCQFTIDREILN